MKLNYGSTQLTFNPHDNTVVRNRLFLSNLKLRLNKTKLRDHEACCHFIILRHPSTLLHILVEGNNPISHGLGRRFERRYQEYVEFAWLSH